MPFLWATLPTSGIQNAKPAQVAAVSVYQNPPVDIKATTTKAGVRDQTLVGDGNVVATYDGERVTADHIEVHFAPDEMRAIATGHVVLTDADGTLTARSLEFSWKPGNRYAKAIDVTLKIAGSTLVARAAFLTPDLWTFDDFRFTTDSMRPPLYQIHGRTLWVYPGRYARILRPSLYLFGGHVLTWPSQLFNLDPRTTGLRPPTPEYRDGGFGINWITGTLIGPSTSLEWHFDAFKHSWPGEGVQVNHSFLPEKVAVGLISPRTELNQRFDFGYLDSVLVPKPESEIRFLDRPRSTISGTTDYNAAVSGRGSSSETFSYPFETVYEIGGRTGGFGSLTDFRLETVRLLRQAVKTRAEIETSWELPVYTLRPDLSLISRADAEAIQGAHSFEWARLSTGLAYRPKQWLALSGGVMGATQNGVAEYDVDPLVYRNGFIARADYSLGPRRISLMTRYDSHLGWFDDEAIITQAMGPFQGYFIYRKYPQDFRFGITLRINQIADVLKRRNFDRNSSRASSGNPGSGGQ